MATTPLKKYAATDKGLGMPTWLGRSIVHNDHAKELELNSAVNEFGLKMPRAQAEDHAYGEYVKGQHVEAQAHHLAGIKAADGAGDKEASRKHHMMYDLHAKAMGHEPIGAPHPDVKALMDKGGQKIYKFKAHRGDAFAIEPPTSPADSSAPLGKAEHDKAPTEYSEWIESIKGPGHYCPHCKGAQSESEKGFSAQKPMAAHAHKPGCPHLKPEMGKSEKTRELLYLLHAAASQVLAKSNGVVLLGAAGLGAAAGAAYHEHHKPSPGVTAANHKALAELKDWWNKAGTPKPAKKAEIKSTTSNESYARSLLAKKPHAHQEMESCGDCKGKSCTKCKGTGKVVKKAELPAGKKTVTDKFHGAGKQLGPSVQPAGPGSSPRRDSAVVKGEMPATKSHCKCEAYKFPHRHGGGYCRQKKS